MTNVQDRKADPAAAGPTALPPTSPPASMAISRWARRHVVLLLVVTACCLLYLLYQTQYYDWALRGPTMNIEVACYTPPLQTSDLRVTVYYDKLALSPVARALGLYQDRQPDRVNTFHFYPLRPEQVRLTPSALNLREVPQGPAVKVHCRAGGKSYFVDVTDRALKNGTLYVYANGAAPDGSQ
jgi:hypothetical protein